MKNILLILLPILFISCSKNVVYVDSSSGKVIPQLKSTQFINLNKICDDVYGTIYVDLNTDVLYYKNVMGYQGFMTCIMKADGTCLTYTEWKENNCAKDE